MKTSPLHSNRRSRIASRRRRAAAPEINPNVFSLMSIPFPVFITDENGRVVPTITLPEFAAISHYKE